MQAPSNEPPSSGVTGDDVIRLLGNRTFDIHLNTDAMWTNVPASALASIR